MTISDKNTLRFCIFADRMMNRGYFKVPFKRRIINFFNPDYIMLFLEAMRKVQYYTNRNNKVGETVRKVAD